MGLGPGWERVGKREFSVEESSESAYWRTSVENRRFLKRSTRPKHKVIPLSASDLQLSLTLLVYLWKADDENAVLFGGFGHIDVYFFGEKNSS